ncbi:hypothetical protein EON65_48040 [archaeon]|nr:MAG: hypothetical protein EON65_48040 [archaeon]
MVSLTLVSTGCFAIVNMFHAPSHPSSVLGRMPSPILHRRPLRSFSPVIIHDSSKEDTTSQQTKNNNTIKTLALLGLVFQNTGLTVAMRLSRMGKSSSNFMYIPSTAVIVSELLKLIISLGLRWNENRLLLEKGDKPRPLRSLLSLEHDIDVLALTSFLYVIQNHLQYLATASLPAAIYQVLVQMKIITAALFSYFFHSKALSSMQWVSIFMLTVGTILVQLSAQSLKVVENVNMQVGLVAVLLSCVTSAMAGVTQESTLKNGRLTLWERNTQICLLSFLLALLASIKDFKDILNRGFFSGYTPLVGLVILLHALGGLLVSIVVKHTSTIVKGFASSGSILLSCCISLVFIQDVRLSPGLVLGALIVSAATVGYNSKSFFSKPPLVSATNNVAAALKEAYDEEAAGSDKKKKT